MSHIRNVLPQHKQQPGKKPNKHTDQYNLEPYLRHQQKLNQNHMSSSTPSNEDVLDHVNLTEQRQQQIQLEISLFNGPYNVIIIMSTLCAGTKNAFEKPKKK